MKRLLRILIPIVAGIATIVPTFSAFAATTATVTVTATPASVIAISNSASTWTINSENSGAGTILKNTTYYANPLGGTTAPSATVDATECDWTIDNTSNVAIDITANWSDMSSGDAMANSNTGSATTTAYGAKVYYEGETLASAVAVKSSGSTTGNLADNLAANTDIKWGLIIATKTNDFSSMTSMTSTVTLTATTH